jgi:hypothetical protein
MCYKKRAKCANFAFHANFYPHLPLTGIGVLCNFAPAYPPRTVAPRWRTVKAGAKLHRYGTYTYYPSCCDAGKPTNETKTRMVPVDHCYRLGRVHHDSKVP